MKRGKRKKYNKEENTKKNHKSYVWNEQPEHYTTGTSAVNSENGVH
jgi:hypothetical protein